MNNLIPINVKLYNIPLFHLGKIVEIIEKVKKDHPNAVINVEVAIEEN